MSQTVFIRRVVLRNYKSIGNCDVHLQPLTYLVGQNGAGKSNFLDALHFVRDALAGSLDNAINERWFERSAPTFLWSSYPFRHSPRVLSQRWPRRMVCL